MLSLSPLELDRDYRAHYSCYSEEDTSEAVLETFRHLDPRPGGRYLNYGCGLWSKAMMKIRAEGYDIVGFDPYVADPADPLPINDIGLLAKMRFDGIMSHNLLEHLVDPRSSLAFMSSLLAENGVMAHSTECFEYRHEYSRFHLFFFTGRSLDVLSKNSGLLCTAAPTKYIRIFKPYRTMR
jgi:SAM-dependent methyltransferase